MVANQPPYGIAGQDLSTMWLDLVQHGKISATIPVAGNTDRTGTSDETIMVNVGIRMVEQDTEKGLQMKCEEFVLQEGLDEGAVSDNRTIRHINETLAKLSNYQDEIDPSGPSPVVLFKRAGAYAVQLQLVRTLRPPPSPGFSGTTTSIPPPYNAETDSFVTGPLRLELRPLVCRLELPNVKLRTPWDVFHNVSPADTRGHFLLVPTLSDNEKNWRGQIFTKDDCNDLVFLASTIEPAGSLILGYNSVGAGASQNHIHCHAWPCPPTPLMQKDKAIDDTDDNSNLPDQEDAPVGWTAYPASNVESIYDFYDVEKDPDIGKVEVSYLKYPVFCVQLSASAANLDLLGKAVAACLEAIDDAPHNLSFLNRLNQPIDDDDDYDDYNEDGNNFADDDDGDDVNNDDGIDGDGDNVDDTPFVDVYVFARSRERSDNLPSLKLGVSEMMGVFHAQSQEELQILSSFVPIDGVREGREVSVMEKCLEDVSYDDEETLWNKIKEKLSYL